MINPILPPPAVEVIEVEFQPETLKDLDAWIAEQPEPADRATAVRAIVTAALEVMKAG